MSHHQESECACHSLHRGDSSGTLSSELKPHVVRDEYDKSTYNWFLVEYKTYGIARPRSSARLAKIRQYWNTLMKHDTSERGYISSHSVDVGCLWAGADRSVASDRVRTQRGIDSSARARHSRPRLSSRWRTSCSPSWTPPSPNPFQTKWSTSPASVWIWTVGGSYGSERSAIHSLHIPMYWKIMKILNILENTGAHNSP